MLAAEPSLSVKLRQRAKAGDQGRSRCGRGAGAAVAAKLVAWYKDHVGPSLLDYARVGPGRRIHMVDAMHMEVPLETGTYECSGVVKNDEGKPITGVQLATVWTLLDHVGRITQAGLGPMQEYAWPVYRLVFETAPVLRKGDVFLEDRGCMDRMSSGWRLRPCAWTYRLRWSSRR